MKCSRLHSLRLAPAFTLVELLVVISILAVLMSLLFSAVSSVNNSARRVQAKNDSVQIVTAVNAYYTDYGHYPIAPAKEGSEVSFTIDNSDLFYILRAIASGANMNDALNSRRVSYISIPEAKDKTHPHGGIANGVWYDPWGPQGSDKPESGIYHIRIDGGYVGTVSDPYPGSDDDDSVKSKSNAPKPVIHSGVIAWSLAQTGVQTYELKDQVLSWK